MGTAKVRNQNGITILEVMIAMLILSLSLLTLLNMAMVAIDANDWSNNTTVAVQKMQEKLEELRATGNPTSGADTAQGIERVWTVENAGTHLRRLDVTVTWQDVRNNTRTNSMTAIVRTDSA